MIRLLSTSLRNFFQDNVEVTLDNITSVRFGDYLNSIPLPVQLAVFRREGWDNSGADDGRVEPRLFGPRPAPRRQARRSRGAARRAALHDDRDPAHQAHGRGRAGRCGTLVPAALAGAVRRRPHGDEPPLRHDHPSGERRDPDRPPARHGRPRRRSSRSCCPTRRSSRSANSCSRASWGRSSGAIPSGRSRSPPRSGRRTSPSRRCCNEMRHAAQAGALAAGRRHDHVRCEAERTRHAPVRRVGPEPGAARTDRRQDRGPGGASLCGGREPPLPPSRPA